MDAPETAWMIACQSRELRRKRTLAVTLEGCSLVLFRSASGTVAALEDRCAHRNTPLSRGTVCEAGLRCIYHGWVWGPDGSLKEMPSLPEQDQDPASCRIKSYPTLEQDGFVWISLSEPNPKGLPRPFPNFRTPGWHSFIMKNCFDAPMDACLENFLDCPHATFLHRYWFRAPTARNVRAIVRSLTDGAEAEYLDEPRDKSLVWWLLAPRGGVMRHVDRFIAPRTSQVDYEFPGGLCYIITSSCSAIDKRTTQVYTVITYRHPWLGPLLRLVFEPLAHRIIRQDIDILAAQYKNISRFKESRFTHTRADLLGRHIIAWRRALADGTALPTADSHDEVEIRL